MNGRRSTQRECQAVIVGVSPPEEHTALVDFGIFWVSGVEAMQPKIECHSRGGADQAPGCGFASVLAIVFALYRSSDTFSNVQK